MHSTFSFSASAYSLNRKTKHTPLLGGSFPHAFILLGAMVIFAAYLVIYYTTIGAEQTLRNAQNAKVSLEEQKKNLQTTLDERSSLQALAQTPIVQSLEEVQKPRYLELDRQGAVARR